MSTILDCTGTHHNCKLTVEPAVGDGDVYLKITGDEAHIRVPRAHLLAALDATANGDVKHRADVYAQLTEAEARYQAERNSHDATRRALAEAEATIERVRALGLLDVADERGRQDAKWGEQNHPDGTGERSLPLNRIVYNGVIAPENADTHYAFGLALMARDAADQAARNGTITWSDILLEEVFEAMAEADPGKLRTELVQIAAVATQWAKAIDRAAPKPFKLPSEAGARFEATDNLGHEVTFRAVWNGPHIMYLNESTSVIWNRYNLLAGCTDFRLLGGAE